MPPNRFWQGELEEALVKGAEIQAERAREELLMRAGGVLALVLAILGLLTAWYFKGSRKVRERLGHYRTEPTL